jgi:hypothetical protein
MQGRGIAIEAMKREKKRRRRRACWPHGRREEGVSYIFSKEANLFKAFILRCI